MRGRDPAGSSGIFPGAHGVATMIIVRAACLDRRGVGAADGGGTHPLDDDFVILGTYLSGLSTGLLSLYCITVSVAGLLARSIPLRAFAGSLS